MSDTYYEEVNVDYTYECPNSGQYLGGDSTETITENYTGPARLVALVDKETHLVEAVLREWEAYDGRPNRRNCDNVVVDCATNPLLCEVLSDYHNNHMDAEDYEDTREIRTIATPEGYSEFTYAYPIHPDELYDDKRTTYVDGEWNIYQNTNEDIIGPTDWDLIRSLRNELLMNSDRLMVSDMPESVTSEAAVVRQKLRDLPAELADIDPVFVPSSFPSTRILEK